MIKKKKKQNTRFQNHSEQGFYDNFIFTEHDLDTEKDQEKGTAYEEFSARQKQDGFSKLLEV